MHETTLLKIALICILLGLPALYILSDRLSLNERALDRITGADVGKHQSITGTVTDVRSGPKLTTITIEQRSTVEVLVFDRVTVPINAKITAKGQLDVKGNRTELIADEIRVG